MSNLTKLTTLYLGKTSNEEAKKIKDISPLENLVNLNHLDLASNEIEDISVLKNLKNLKHVGLQSNKIKNFETLLQLKHLSEVWPQHNPRELTNNQSDFMAAKKFFDFIIKESFSKSDVSKLEEILNSNDDVKNYFSDETLDKLLEYKNTLSTENSVKNTLFEEFRINSIKGKLVSFENLEPIVIEKGKNLQDLLPKKIKVKVEKEKVKALGEKHTDATGKDVFTIAIVDENGNLINENIDFKVGSKNLTTENGFLKLDTSFAPITYLEAYVNINSDKYKMLNSFSFTKVTATGKLGYINKIDISSLSEEEISELLVIKLTTKSQLPDENVPKIFSENQKEYIKIKIVKKDGTIVNEAVNFKSNGKTYTSSNGFLTVEANALDWVPSIFSVESEKYVINPSFSYTKENGIVKKINSVDISNKTQEEISKLLVIILEEKTNPTPPVNSNLGIKGNKAGFRVIDQSNNVIEIEGLLKFSGEYGNSLNPILDNKVYTVKSNGEDEKFTISLNSSDYSLNGVYSITTHYDTTNGSSFKEITANGETIRITPENISNIDEKYFTIKVTSNNVTPPANEDENLGIKDNKLYLKVVDENGDIVSKPNFLKAEDNSSNSLNPKLENNLYVLTSYGELGTFNITVNDSNYKLLTKYSVDTDYDSATYKGKYTKIQLGDEVINVNESNVNSIDKKFFTLKVEKVRKTVNTTNSFFRMAVKSSENNIIRANKNNDNELIDLELPIKWDLSNFKNEVGKYTITGSIVLPDEIKNPDNIVPTVEVEILKEKETSSNIVLPNDKADDNKTENKNKFFKENNIWYYADKNGNKVVDSWIYESNKWYYMDKNGALITNNWIFKDGYWFFANVDGRISENEWVFVKEKWYFAKKGGYITTNQWHNINGKWYYFDNAGMLLQNTKTPDGYTVNHNGEWIK